MAATKVLIVEDETPIREMIAFHLARAGFETLEAADCRRARELLADERPDLALVDWMLPDMSGLELTRMLRRDQENENLAIIMLTARADEHDKVTGLDSGADDYLDQAFLATRAGRKNTGGIASLGHVRRGSHQGRHAGTGSPPGIAYSLAAPRCSSDRRNIGLLHFLMAHPERVYSRSLLLDRVWGANVYIEERTVDVHVRRLRKALERSGADRYIQTVRGAGYRFSPRSADA